MSIPQDVKSIYLIIGHSGEFGDYETWPVCAYWKESAAKEHARLAHLAAEKIYMRQMDQETYHYEPVHVQTEWDDRCYVDYTGTDYQVKEINLYEKIVRRDS